MYLQGSARQPQRETVQEAKQVQWLKMSMTGCKTAKITWEKCKMIIKKDAKWHQTDTKNYKSTKHRQQRKAKWLWRFKRSSKRCKWPQTDKKMKTKRRKTTIKRHNKTTSKLCCLQSFVSFSLGVSLLFRRVGGLGHDRDQGRIRFIIHPCIQHKHIHTDTQPKHWIIRSKLQ